MKFARLKKNIGFFEKWIREIVLKPKSNAIVDIPVETAYRYIDGICPHEYIETETIHIQPETDYDISIIIPVYNREKYISKCLDSVLNQMEQYNVEIILVDDGSTDASGEICDKYAEQYPRIVYVYHKQSGGVSDARNYGVRKSRGKYIYFLDSDDVLLDIRSLYSMALKYNTDIIEGNFILFSSEDIIQQEKVHLTKGDIGVCDISNNFDLLQSVAGFVWGKLYKRSLWDGIVFPIGFLFEDTIEEIVLLRKAKRYMFSSVPCQGYRQNPTSICNTVNENEKCLDSYLVYRYWIENASAAKLDDPIFFRQTLKQFGSKTYSRIWRRPEYELKCSLIIMKDLLNRFTCRPRLTFYERVMLKQIMNQNLVAWQFMCKYCFL